LLSNNYTYPLPFTLFSFNVSLPLSLHRVPRVYIGKKSIQRFSIYDIGFVSLIENSGLFHQILQAMQVGGEGPPQVTESAKGRKERVG